jgi:hypothetical protein
MPRQDDGAEVVKTGRIALLVPVRLPGTKLTAPVLERDAGHIEKK